MCQKALAPLGAAPNLRHDICKPVYSPFTRLRSDHHIRASGLSWSPVSDCHARVVLPFPFQLSQVASGQPAIGLQVLYLCTDAMIISRLSEAFQGSVCPQAGRLSVCPASHAQNSPPSIPRTTPVPLPFTMSHMLASGALQASTGRRVGEQPTKHQRFKLDVVSTGTPAETLPRPQKPANAPSAGCDRQEEAERCR